MVTHSQISLQLQRRLYRVNDFLDLNKLADIIYKTGVSDENEVNELINIIARNAIMFSDSLNDCEGCCEDMIHYEDVREAEKEAYENNYEMNYDEKWSEFEDELDELQLELDGLQKHIRELYGDKVKKGLIDMFSEEIKKYSATKGTIKGDSNWYKYKNENNELVMLDNVDTDTDRPTLYIKPKSKMEDILTNYGYGFAMDEVEDILIGVLKQIFNRDVKHVEVKS